ncbi:DNA repair protein RecN [Lysinibacillus sp. 2017]|uniref:DNA repair protein RecN n=1 Tax=unclassified Lysinibacillus TaxID=2636778 RepID=UPI000D529248|nr:MULTISPECIES: DNA repair protein RecN [unclassified Lysinibacillus]AWE07908.1 DNA repair protein RecN [Lysinibacillus sp. 2017]TGN33144.1 DNA repair protein RecN [Lysinibacillus sp. S2017]
MLRELSIRNFAIIDDLTVGFVDGLTVLTGETGAGKSIIIDAVNILAGGRGSTEFIRHGEKKAELGGLFQVNNEQHPIYLKLEEHGIEVEEGTIILRRDLHDSGKSICRVNGKLVPLSVLREIGGSLIDIHGQHENQELMDEKFHIHLLDHFAHRELLTVKADYDDAFEAYRQLKREVAELSIDEQRMAQRIDLYQFQIQELEQAALRVDEEEALTEERTRLMNFHKIFERANMAYDSISGDSNGLDKIGNAMRALEDIIELDPIFKEPSEAVTSSFYALQDAAYQIKNTLDDLEYDEERLNEVEQRLALYQTMKRKYGTTVEEILAYFDKIEEELSQLLNRDETMHNNEQMLAKMEANLDKLSAQLTVIRKENALKLSEAIMNELRFLHMEKAQFIVNFDKLNHFDANGKDGVAFYISTNVGEPPKSLPKVASGGELSRMMLALKTIFSTSNGITSIIFDEVDTGVSGRVAQAIAEKIAAISINSQVLCISHLPQVAAMADHQYYIKKQVEHDRTFTTITEMQEQERIEEISRMMSGAEITELTLQHASELIQMASERKTALIK